MKITIELDPVDFVAQNESGVFDPSEMPNESLAYVFTYGARRAMQDSINSAAHKARTDGDDFDAAAFVAARLDDFRNGNVSTRGAGGGGVDAVTRMMMKLIRPTVKASDSKAYKNADTAARDKMVRDYIDAMADKQRDALKRTAEARIDREKADAAELAKLGLAVNV